MEQGGADLAFIQCNGLLTSCLVNVAPPWLSSHTHPPSKTKSWHWRTVAETSVLVMVMEVFSLAVDLAHLPPHDLREEIIWEMAVGGIGGPSVGTCRGPTGASSWSSILMFFFSIWEGGGKVLVEDKLGIPGNGRHTMTVDMMTFLFASAWTHRIGSKKKGGRT